VPTIPSGEDTQLSAVEERLTSRFENRVTRAQVHDCVARAYASFASARIRTYIPLLVTKRATDELRAASRSPVST
jgi:hypothetical protein